MSEKETVSDNLNQDKDKYSTENVLSANNNSKEKDINVPRQRKKRKTQSKKRVTDSGSIKKKPTGHNRVLLSFLALGCTVAFSVFVYENYFDQSRTDSSPQSNNETISSVNSSQSDPFVTSTKNQVNMLDVDTRFYKWSAQQQHDLKNTILNRTVNLKFYNAAVDNKNTMSTLWAKRDTYSDFMNDTDMLVYHTGYPQKNGIGVSLNNQGFVDNILQDSPAYNYGIRLGWKLLRANGQIISYIPKDFSKIEALISSSDSVWLSRSGQIYSFNKIPAFPAIGSIAEGWIQGGILSIRINYMTERTPGRIYQILKSNLDNNVVRGIVLDLRTSSNSFTGLPETAWILNNQNISSSLGYISDRNNKSYNIVAKPLPFNYEKETIAKINSLKKIVVVNGATGGTFELLANAVAKEKDNEMRGDTSANQTILTADYVFGSNQGVKISTYYLKLPDNQSLPLKPSNRFNYSLLDSLYQIKKN